jgi:hypothetical protein
MQPVLILMEFIVYSLFIIIIISKISIFHKILLVVGIHIFNIFNEKIREYLQIRIKQKIPNKQVVKENIKDGKNIYGMPSGHAQYISFFMGFLYLFYMNTINSKLIGNKYIYILLILNCIAYIYEFIACIVYNYHTPAQYIVGTILGILTSFVSFFIIFALIGKKI